MAALTDIAGRSAAHLGRATGAGLQIAPELDLGGSVVPSLTAERRGGRTVVVLTAEVLVVVVAAAKNALLPGGPATDISSAYVCRRVKT